MTTGVIECLNFDDILEKIFSYLTKDDLLNCKLVNQKWLNIVMSSAWTVDGRHLYLKNCHINNLHPPASVIMNSEYRYTKLTVSLDAQKFSSMDQTDTFWKFMGESLTEVSFKTFNQDSIRIMRKLPLVKYLDLCETSWYQFMLRIRHFDESFGVLKTIKRLTLRTLALKDLPEKAVFDEMFPALVELIAKEVDMTDWVPGTNLPKALKINCIMIGRFRKEREFVHIEKALKSLQEFSVKQLNYHEYLLYDEPELCKNLELIMKNYPKMDVLLQTNLMPPSSVLANIVELKLNLTGFPLDPLKNLTKLKKLTILSTTNGCCFTHTPTEQESLQELNLDIYNLNCTPCMLSIAMSYKNVKKINISTLTLDYQCTTNFIKKIIQKWEHLEEFEFSIIPVHRFPWADIIEHQQEFVRPKMKEFILSRGIIMTGSNIAKLHHVFPNLMKLDMTFDENINDSLHVIREIIPRFRKLRYLTMAQRNNKTMEWKQEYKIRHDMTEVMNYIISHGSSLRIINFNNVFEKFPWNLECLENLFSVSYSIGSDAFCPDSMSFKHRDVNYRFLDIHY